MARRGLTVIFTLLGVACFISIAALVGLYLFLGRQPSVPSNATLSLRVGGDLAEVAPDDVVGYLRGSHTRTVRSIVDNLPQGEGGSARGRRAPEAGRLDHAVLGPQRHGLSLARD